MSGLGLLRAYGLTAPNAPSGDLAYVSASKVGAAPAWSDLHVARPSGVKSGDTLILVVGRRANSASPITTGWTQLGVANRANARSWIYSRIATNDEPDDYPINAASGATSAAIVIAIRGATSVVLAPASTTQTAPSILAESVPAILMCGWINAPYTQPPAWLPPTGMFLAADTGANAALQVSAAAEILTAAGNTGTRKPIAGGDFGSDFVSWSLIAG